MTRPSDAAADAAWEALSDEMWGHESRPEEIIARHRPAIEAAIRDAALAVFREDGWMREEDIEAAIRADTPALDAREVAFHVNSCHECGCIHDGAAHLARLRAGTAPDEAPGTCDVCGMLAHKWVHRLPRPEQPAYDAGFIAGIKNAHEAMAVRRDPLDALPPCPNCGFDGATRHRCINGWVKAPAARLRSTEGTE